MSEKHAELDKVMANYGRGFTMGTEVWIVRWVPVEADCPCCEGTGTVPGRTPVEGEVYACGACGGHKTLPIDIKIEIVKGIVSGVQLNRYEYFSGNLQEPIDVASVGYSVRAVEVLNGAGKGIAVSWAANYGGDSDELLTSRELAEAKAAEMVKKSESQKVQASIISKEDLLK